MENEIWKDIKGYEGYYQVSNMGRVKSMRVFKTPKNGVICRKDSFLSTKTTHVIVSPSDIKICAEGKVFDFGQVVSANEISKMIDAK